MPLPARPRITLLAPPLIPGQRATLTAVLDTRRATRVDFVVLFILATQVSGPGQPPVRHRLGARLRPAGQLAAGRTELPCRIDVPPTLAPSYQGQWGRVAHEATVHVSIPYWPDVRASFQLTARPAPRAPRAWDGLVFSSGSGGAPVSGPYAEVSLVTRSISPGSVLTGAIALYNVAACRYDRVTVTLRQIERFGAQSHVVSAWHIDLPGERFTEGQRVDFALRVPALAPSMRLGVIDVEHDLLVTARSTWSALLEMPIPLEVLPDAVATSAQTAPPLGDQRVRVYWERVADQLGFVLEDDALVRRAAGRVVTVRRDVTGAKPLIVAEVRHPALGLELRSVPRAGLASLIARGPAAGVGAIDRRLVFEARCAAQAEAHLQRLGRELTPLLSGPMTIHALADDHVALALPGSGTTEAPIVAAGEAALALDTLIEDALARTPLPPPLEEHREGWVTLAARLGGTLELGSGTVSASADETELRIRPVFDDEGRAIAIRLSRREPTALDVSSPIVCTSTAALAGWREEARQVGARLLEHGGELSVEPTELAYTARLGDEWRAAEAPMRAERTVEALSQLAAALRPRRGPFR